MMIISTLSPRASPHLAVASDSTSTTAVTLSSTLSMSIVTLTSTPTTAALSTASSASSTNSAATATSSTASQSEPFHWTAGPIAALVVLLVALVVGVSLISFFKIRSLKKRPAEEATIKPQRQLEAHYDLTDVEVGSMAERSRIQPIRAMKSKPVSRPNLFLSPADEYHIEDEQPQDPFDLVSPVSYGQAMPIAYQRASTREIKTADRSTLSSISSSTSSWASSKQRKPTMYPARHLPHLAPLKRQTSFDRSITPPDLPTAPPVRSSSRARPPTPPRKIRESFSFERGPLRTVTPAPPAAYISPSHSARHPVPAMNGIMSRHTQDTRRRGAVIINPSSSQASSEAASLDESKSPISPIAEAGAIALSSFSRS